jgi:hypothetical protein
MSREQTQRRDGLRPVLNNLGSPPFFTDDGASMMIDPKATLIAVLDNAEQYRALAIRAKDRGERESYERIVGAIRGDR